LLKIQMLIIFIRLLMKNTARTNHYLSGQRILWITSGIQQKYVIHRRNILAVFFMSNLMKIINIWIFSNRILQIWTGHTWHLIISCLDPQKTSGPDDINHRMVIASENTICRPLCKLFNLSLRKICFPSCWKLANVTTVFKKSDKSITSNYRPISLFSCVSRINFSLAFSLDIPLHIS
jgi:sarcosine oxidase/L-pipecolate oxidase